GGGLDGVWDVAEVDLVARGLPTVDHQVEIRLADDAQQAEVLDAFDLAHRGDDRVAHAFESVKVIAVDLDGELAFDPADGFLHVVGDRLGEIPDDAGQLLQLVVHRRDQLLLVLVEQRPPLLLRLQVHEVLRIEEAGDVGSVVWASDLAHAARHLWKRREDESRLTHEAHAFGRPGARRKSPAHPDRAFVEMGQEFRSDDAAAREKRADRKTHGGAADNQPAMRDRPTNLLAVAFAETGQHRVVPFGRARSKQQARQYRRDHHREGERAQQGERDCPRHRLEQTAFDLLQREDRQIRGDDDGDRV